MKIQQGGREKEKLDGTTNELRDNATPNECVSPDGTSGGANNMRERKNM